MEPGLTDGRLAAVLAAIDAANAADPHREPDGRTVEVVYGERMSAELATPPEQPSRIGVPSHP